MASWVLPVRGFDVERQAGSRRGSKLRAQPRAIRAMAAATWLLLWVAVAVVGIRPGPAAHSQPVTPAVHTDACLSAGTIINADAAPLFRTAAAAHPGCITSN